MDSSENYDPDIEKFQQFIFEMDDVLEEFLLMTSELEYDLDYSISSLGMLESYIDKNISSKGDINTITRASRYLGEVFRRNVGGRWDLCLDDPKNINFKLPIINDYSDLDIEFCPVAIIGNYIVNKRKGLILKAVESNMEFARK